MSRRLSLMPSVLAFTGALALTAGCGQDLPGDPVTIEPEEEPATEDGPAEVQPGDDTPTEQPADNACAADTLCLDVADDQRINAIQDALQSCTLSDGFEVPPEGVQISRLELWQTEDGGLVIDLGAANLYGDCACDYPGYALEVLAGDGALGDAFFDDPHHEGTQRQRTEMQLYGIGGCDEMSSTIPLFIEPGQQLKLRATVWRNLGEDLDDAVEFTVRR